MGIGAFGRLTRMESTAFYRKILGLKEPWSVSKVDLDMEAKRVMIRVEVDRRTKWFHPEIAEGEHECSDTPRRKRTA